MVYLRERYVNERRVRIARVRSEPRREKIVWHEGCCWFCLTEDMSNGIR